MDNFEQEDILADHPSKVKRISRQTKGLVEDIRTWVELKMQFTQLDIEDRVDKKVNEAANNAVLAAAGLITLVFVLISLALGLGLLFNSNFFGFLTVTGLLILGMIIATVVNPRLVKIDFFDQDKTEDNKQQLRP